MNSTVTPINRDTARKLVDANGVRRVVAKQVPDGFVVVLVTQNQDYAINNSRSPKGPRTFRTLDTCMNVISDIWVRHFDVELMNSPRDTRRLF